MDTMAAEKEITSVEDADMVFIRNTYFKYKEESFFWRYWHWILIGFVSGVFVFLVAGCTIESHLRKARLQAQQHGTKEVDPLSFSPCGNYTTRARCSNDDPLCRSRARRIVGGSVSETSWPWMAEIVYGDKHHCGAVLISMNLLLTAAHCIFHDGNQIYANSLQVKLGSKFRLSAAAQTVRISDIFIHHSFKLSTLENDIAVIKLEKEVIATSSVWPICLSGLAEFSEGASVLMTGWGRTHPEGEFASELREAEVPVVSASQCIKANEGLFEGISVSRSNNLCVGAGMKRPEYGCNGDSGGPLMVQTEDKKWALIGLMSWGGPECSAVTTDSYTVSTKLYMYRTWIEQMLTI